MNPLQQHELIRSQVADIVQTEDVQVVEQPSPLELQLYINGHGGKRYHLKLDLTNYDLEPPKLYVLDEQGNVTWDPQKLPPWPIRNGSRHPGLNRDFFCIEGTDDYHSHPLHAHEPWDALRNIMPLAALVGKIAQTFKQPPMRPAQKLVVGINGLGQLPLRHIMLQFANGEEVVFEPEDGTAVNLKGLELTFSNNQVLRIEGRDAT